MSCSDWSFPTSPWVFVHVCKVHLSLLTCRLSLSLLVRFPHPSVSQWPFSGLSPAAPHLMSCGAQAWIWHSRYIRAGGPGSASSSLPIPGGSWHLLHKVMLHRVTQQVWLVAGEEEGELLFCLSEPSAGVCMSVCISVTQQFHCLVMLAP